MPKVYEGEHPNDTERKARKANNSVPDGHRTKCRKCGCTDNVQMVGPGRRLIRCGRCGGTVARRRAPRAPKILSYAVVMRQDGVDLPLVRRNDRFAAEQIALAFVDRGPVARTRIAQITELLDGTVTGKCCTLRYDNYKRRELFIQWSNGCEPCKGRGTVPHKIPAKAGDKALIRFVPCEACQGLGGQLAREVNYNHHFASLKG